MILPFAVVTALLQQTPAPAWVGTISLETGSAQIARGGKVREALRYQRARAGDRLTVAPGGRAAIGIDSSRQIWRVEGSSVVEIGSGKLRFVSGQAPTLLRTVAQSRSLAGQRPPIGLTGGIRGSDSTIMPFGAVEQAPVTLTWVRPAATTGTVVELLGNDGNSLWTADLDRSQSSVTLPEGRMRAGDWYRAVVTVNMSGTPMAASEWLRILPAPEREALARERVELEKSLAEMPVARALAVADLEASYGVVWRLPETLTPAFPESAKSTGEGRALQWHLGRLLERAGYRSAALAAYQRAWSGGERDPELAAAIRRTGGGSPSGTRPLRFAAASELETLLAAGKYTEALPVAEAAVAARRGGSPVELALSLVDLGNVLTTLSRFDAARSALDEALKLLADAERPASAATARALLKRGSLANDMGLPFDALALLNRARPLLDATRPGSAELAECIRLQGDASYAAGDTPGAYAYCREALDLAKKVVPGSLQLAETMTTLGDLYGEMSDLDQAQQLYESALAIQSRIAPRSLDLAATLHKMGNRAYMVGDFDTAERRYGEALALIAELAPGSLRAAGSLNNSAGVASQRGNATLARQRYEEALAIYQRLAPDSTDAAGIERNLGLMLMSSGNPAEARRRFENALARIDRVAPNSTTASYIVQSLGVLAQDQKDDRTARRMLERALAIREATTSPESFSTLETLRLLNGVLRKAGTGEEFALSLRRALAINEKLLLSQAAARGESLGTFGREIVEALRQVGWMDRPATLYSWVASLRGAGLTLESRVNLARREAETDPKVRTLFAAAQTAQTQERDWMTKRRPPQMSDAEWTGRLQELREKRQAAEAELTRTLRAKDGRFEQALKVGQLEIQDAIPPGCQLIEFLRVNTWDAAKGGGGKDVYAAFVVGSRPPVRYFPLADVGTVDALVRDWQTQIARANDPNGNAASLATTEAKLREIGRKLYDLLVKPLGPLGPNLLIAPDGALHRMPLAALVDEKGRYWIETAKLSLVGSGRDLVERSPAGKPGPPVVMAAPAYDLTANEVRQANAGIGNSYRMTRGFNVRGAWNPLPGAMAEGEAVAKTLGVRVVSGKQATEERLLSLVRPRVLHLATHGFFFGPVMDRQVQGDVLASGMVGKEIRVSDSPMIRSGLVMAGANNDAELKKGSLSDGWATALEISGLDLRGTDLVVLSACETGLGDERMGEGVFGLQRAFRFAGARSLIMSLFQVPDAASSLLFQRFYSRWRPDGSKIDALRAAQLSLLAKPETRHPRCWAGFVLLGAR